MRFILDANALIYLIKADLAEKFLVLLEGEVVIDNNVYREVVEKGLENNYLDAYIAKDFLEKNQIPIIPVNISSELFKFRDPGETSCYILSKNEGICISSDVRATKKFEQLNTPFMELDTFFYNKLLAEKINTKMFLDIMDSLKKINGTTAKRISVFLKLISRRSEKNGQNR